MKHYHKNPRQITNKQAKDLKTWLVELGDLSGIVHDLNTDEIIGGNMRIEVMGLMKAKPVITETFDPPTDQGTVSTGYFEKDGERYAYRAVRWTERQAEQANIVANRAGGTFDFDILADQWSLPDLLEWGFEESELQLDWGDDEAEPDPGAQVDKAAELQEKWGVKRGQIFLAGRHRIMCGDSTIAEDVGRLMGGVIASLCASDPPYNVGKDYGEGVDDGKAEAEHASFSAAWFLEWQQVSERQIVTPGGVNTVRWARWFDSTHCGCWIKTNALSRGRVSNSWCWEPIYFHGKGWARRRANDVFNFPIGRQANVANHPCPKPLKMWVDLVENYTEPDDPVSDAFLGSGTSIVACEQTGRIGYGMEISEKYVAVSLERLSGMGLDVELIDD